MKIFMWFESSIKFSFRQVSYPTWGEGDFYHTLKQLLEMNFSESLKKRFNSAKPGTAIRVRENLYVQRLNDDEINEVKARTKKESRMKEIEKEILDATRELQMEYVELKNEKFKLRGAVNGIF